MFLGFLIHLRAHGLKVATTEWLLFMRALAEGHGKSDLGVFYHLARALLVKKESLYDLYDRAFASYFQGLGVDVPIDEELLRWLENPVLPRELTEEEQAMLEAWDLDRLRAEYAQRRAEQKKRHDGGNRWIGTGGTSPFGHGGQNPAGIRVGGEGGGRSAVELAESRRFANLRNDRLLDTRHVDIALRKLRRLSKQSGPEELDLDRTIDKSAKDGGEIDLVFSPAKASRIKLLLLMDVGGSMDPHVEVCEQLFASAHAAHHFKKFTSYFFHNCVYGRLYSDISRWRGRLTEDILRRDLDATWTVIFVGDAWMAPYELEHPTGSLMSGRNSGGSGLDWLKRLRQRCPRSVWLNPEPERVWGSHTIALVRTVFPMFPLTLGGLDDAVDVLRGARPNLADLSASEARPHL